MSVDDEGETQFGDLLEDTSAVSPEQSVMTLLRSEELEDLIGRLDDRTASIIKMRYGIDDGRERTLTEVGKQHGLTRERIRQIEKHALLELKKMARRHGFRRSGLSSRDSRLQPPPDPLQPMNRAPAPPPPWRRGSLVSGCGPPVWLAVVRPVVWSGSARAGPGAGGQTAKPPSTAIDAPVM